MKWFEHEGLEKELVELIVRVCNVLDPVPEDLSFDSPVVGPDSALGLDSLDAVEIVVAVEKKYHVRIDAQETSRKIFKSFHTLAAFIRQNAPKEASAI
ncbi:MAG TPA: phosphopantetheine-binding protein [Syntrophorhabdaceae bacterium]|nr:phosphopantetheine-binding protein [Syntrophorhabdaceae bacterium]